MGKTIALAEGKYDVLDSNAPFSSTRITSLPMWIVTNTNISLLGDTIKEDTIKKDVENPFDFPMQDIGYDPLTSGSKSNLFLDNPSNVKTQVEVDSSLDTYSVYQNVGKYPYRPPTVMTYEEYSQYQMQNSIKNYWKEKASSESVVNQTGLIPKIYVGPKVFDRIFGGNYVDIRPNGSALLTFAGSFNKNEDPSFSQEQQSQGGFNFDQQIQMNVIGNIGEKLKITANWDTEASFDFENQLKLEYTGYEEEIIQKIEAGNVSLPLNSSLITGAQNLFGIKTQLKFGRLTVTALASQQRGKKEEIEIEGGAQSNNFDLRADDYDANRHYFLSQYFRSQYNTSLKNLPYINSPINITRVEVWVTNKRDVREGTRNIISFLDLAENQSYKTTLTPNASLIVPDNQSNNLYAALENNNEIRTAQTANSALSILSFGVDSFRQGTDFQKVDNARKLQSNEFKINSQLGFISLNSSLNSDEVLAVAYEYTIGADKFQVGEFSQDIQPNVSKPNVLFLKMLKPVNIRTDLPTWNLMMKNIYSIGAYQVNQLDFQMNIFYKDDKTGFNQTSLPKESGELSGKLLIELMNLDNLRTNSDPGPDGVFDFIDGVTIDASNGRIIFPLLQPFGDDLRELFGTNTSGANQYVFDDLYDLTKNDAQQNAELNKFYLKGKYLSSSSSEIPLNALNVIKGSVIVSAGSQQLIENQDYTVDYLMGRVSIINQGILNSGQKIRVNFETNSFFTIQSKSLVGSRFDYKVSDDINLGGSIMRLHERPITPKIDIGEEPISNVIWGLDANFRKESKFVTKMLDKLPIVKTKEPSSFNISMEYAQLNPGHPSSIEDEKQEGIAYIDDFESSKIPFDMSNAFTWRLASTPQRFPQGVSAVTALDYNKQRAKLAWYVIDPLFWRDDNAATPKHIKGNKDLLSNHYVREVLPREVFPNRDETVGETNLPTLDLAFYPNQRGPYNYDTNIDQDGKLLNPASRWGGVMKAITTTTDFEAANIEFIEFWMLDPFLPGVNGTTNTTGGELFLNLGNVSEDILKDSRRQFEDGLPKSGTVINVDSTAWGRVSTLQSIAHAFDNAANSRKNQDLGLDGLNDADERTYFDSVYISKIASIFGTTSKAYQDALLDPSTDNYHFYRGGDYDAAEVSIKGRYKNYNAHQGNSPDDTQNPESYPTLASNSPDDEDLNRDNTLNEIEEYYEYKIKLAPASMNVGQNFIADRVVTNVVLPNGTTESVSWYQFRIPVKNPNNVVGSIADFKSIRFMRLYLTNFSEDVVLRFAKFQLTGGPWRRYEKQMYAGGLWSSQQINASKDTKFDISTVNIEENGNFDNTNIPYILPPGIGQELDVASPNQRKLNEQSLQLCVENLQDGDARATFKNINMDFRAYKKIKMWVHAQDQETKGSWPFSEAGQLTAFIRLGTDFTQNYYEFEIPLNPTKGPVDPNSPGAADRIWDIQNEMNVTFEGLGVAKADRNGKGVSLTQPHTIIRGGKRITVIGNPDLGAIKTIMIGVRNPNNGDNKAFSGCVWFNELRATDFVEDAGWAANARVTTKLADIGTITAAGSHKSVGFGSIETKISNRSRNNTSQYDLSSNIELSKFMPEVLQLRVPMYWAYGETFIDPQFDPLNQDVLMTSKLETYETEAEKDTARLLVQDYTRRKSLNFTNVQRVRKPSKKPHIYDIENVALTYAFSETYNKNINTQYNLLQNRRGGVAYNYSKPNVKNYQPFARISAFSKPRYRLIKDFNYTLFPKSLSFRTDLDRRYGETLLRSSDAEAKPTFNKAITMDRVYDLKWDFTRALRMSFSATNNARVDEPDGRIDTKEKKDTILQNIFSGGRNTRYNQLADLDYRLPLEKISFLNWMNANARYSGGYTWTSAPLNNDTLGNTIQNTRNQSYNGGINMTTLYNKNKFLREINNARPSRPSANPAAKDTTKKLTDGNLFKAVLRSLMTMRTISWNYSITDGTLLPGYLPKSEFFGSDFSENPTSPGLGFVLGQQMSINELAASNDWLSKNQYLNTLYTNTHNTKFSAGTALEPFRDFKVDLKWMRNQGLNQEQYYRYDTTVNRFMSNSLRETGNYNISYMIFATAFTPDDTLNNSPIFDQMAANREIIANRMNTTTYNPNYVNGQKFYDKNSQEVLIPSLLAAYRGKSADGFDITTMPPIPLPNWFLSYGGLSKVPWAKKYFTNVNLTNRYTSSYLVNNFITSLDYQEQPGVPDMPNSVRSDGTFYSKYTIERVSLKEQFAPLFGIDLTWIGNVTTKFEYKRSRDLTFSLANLQMTEMRRVEYVIGLGYRRTGLNAPFKFRGRQLTLKNDITFKFDFTLTDTRTVQRELDGISTVTSGMENIRIGPNIDYVVNQRFKVKLFYEKTINNPFISSSSKNSSTLAGVEVRFTLSQ